MPTLEDAQKIADFIAAQRQTAQGRANHACPN